MRPLAQDGRRDSLLRVTTRQLTADQLAAWRAFLTAHAAVVDRLGREMEGEIGLPLSWYEVMLHIYEAEGQRLRMHELADSLLLSRSAATRFVDRMEQAGLLHRVECSSDRRGTFVALTDRGLQLFRAAGPVHLRGIEEHFADHIDGEEAAQLADMMERLTAAQRR